MDSYLANASVSEIDNFFLNLNFETLSGCQFQCKGCEVEKFAAQELSEEHYQQLISVLDSYADSGVYVNFIAFIGPTDFLVADNTIRMLEDPRWIEVLRRFKRLSLQTTCLNLKNAEAIGAVLRKHYGDLELEINVLLEPEKIRNEKYMNTIRTARDRLFEALAWKETPRSFAIMNVYDYDLVKNHEIKKLMKDYEALHESIKDMFDTTIDFNFSMARKGSALTREGFLEAAVRIKNLYNETICDKTATSLRFSFGHLQDCLIERQYNWRNGNFYISPLLYERYVGFIEELKIDPPPFTRIDLEDFERKIETQQYQNLDQKEECGECEFVTVCNQRQILHLMDIYRVKECIVAKDALIKVNS